MPHRCCSDIRLQTPIYLLHQPTWNLQMNDSNLVGLATTELQLLQSVIARQDEFKEKTKTLAVALFLAISIGFFSGQVTISPLQYIAGSIGVCLTFMILEGAYGVTEIYAENRVKEVEAFLREEPGSNYSGPNISSSLLRAGSFIPLWNSVKRWRTSFL